jgi:hypothetical protein
MNYRTRPPQISPKRRRELMQTTDLAEKAAVHLPFCAYIAVVLTAYAVAAFVMVAVGLLVINFGLDLLHKLLLRITGGAR